MDKLTYYLVIINLITFALFVLDKSFARKRKGRIPNATLIILILLGGALGGGVGMYYFRHKTKKVIFKLALFVGVVICIIGMIWII